MRPTAVRLTTKSAVIDGDYRYILTRSWEPSPVRNLGCVAWIMLNPSTADAEKDDPTLIRCIDYSQALGFTSLSVTNLFAYRESYSNKLHSVEKPIGDNNDQWIISAAQKADFVVVAWGNSGMYLHRNDEVERLLGNLVIPLHALAVTKYGQPCHPLYLKPDLSPVALDTLRRGVLNEAQYESYVKRGRRLCGAKES